MSISIPNPNPNPHPHPHPTPTPNQVGISIKLLSDAKMLNSMAGQTTLTAAFIDDVFSLVLLVLLASLAEGQVRARVGVRG